MAKRNKTIKQLTDEGFYVHRHKKTVLNGMPTMATPQRKSEYPDEFDYIFSSKEEFNAWYKDLVKGIAELDESMNYCKYFKRVKGNTGNYERDGLSFPVNGEWCGLHDFCFSDPSKSYKPAILFVRWLKENGFDKDWFELMDRYK